MKIALYNTQTVHASARYRECPGGRRVLVGRSMRRLVSNRERVREIAQAIAKHKPDLFVGPEYLFLDRRGSLSAEAAARLVGKLEDLTQGTDTVLVPGTVVSGSGRQYANSVPVIYGGKTVKRVRKKSLSGYDEILGGLERGGPDLNTGFGRGQRGERYVRRRLVEVNGVKYFIEVCADHSMSELFAARQEMRMPKVADVQIVVANEGSRWGWFGTVSERLFARPGGLFIECNSGGPKAGKEAPNSFIGRVGRGAVAPCGITKLGPEQEGIHIVEIEL